MKLKIIFLFLFFISIIKIYNCNIIVKESLYLLARKNFSIEIANAIYENFNVTKGEVYEGSLCRAANYNVLSNNSITSLTPIYLIVEEESKYIQCQEEGLQNFLIVHIYGRKNGSGIVRIEKFNRINLIFELNNYDYYHVKKALILFKTLKNTLTLHYSGIKKIFIPKKSNPPYWIHLITGGKLKNNIENIDDITTNIISYFNFFLLISELIISSTIIVILIYCMKGKHKKKKVQLNKMILELKQANTLDIPNDKELIDPNDIKSYFYTIVNQVSKYIDNHIKESNNYDVVPEQKNIENLMVLEPYMGNNKINELFDELFKNIMPSISFPHHIKNYNLKPGTNISDVISSIFISYISLIGIDRIPKSTIKMIEQGVYNWFGKAIGLPETFLYKQNSFNTTVVDSLFQNDDGGGLILSNNILANLQVIYGARKMKIMKILKNYEKKDNFDNYLDIQKKLIVYMNEDQLGNYEKLCNSIFIICKGIPFSDKIELCQACLTKQIEEDISDGYIPFLIISSFASTTLCSYDDLNEISYVCEKFDIWLHVDATYGGFSLINSKIRKKALGIEKCNSLLICPDKFMICSPEISILFSRNFQFIFENFNIKELQNPEDKWLINTEDVKKFLSLKLWFVFKIYGIEKLRERITKLIQDTNKLKELIKNDNRLELYDFLSLGIVSFKVSGDSQTKSSIKTSQLIKFINEKRQIYVSEYDVNKNIKLIQLSVIHITKTSNIITNHWGEIQDIIDEFFNTQLEIPSISSSQHFEKENIISEDFSQQ
ncbi:FI02861p [Strongyloides ratti]|uniref:FI02861p n=1 Tax=Strongyloides ratti TaxID=34506 RepID=A0A090LPG8_STRRB|nr:FI02861p [Strongyloides ratti]CEF70089.1 FI02861p [Strongyloides ratti]